MKDKGIEVCKIKFENFEHVKQFCQMVLNFASDIYLCSDNYVMDAKSIMGVYSLDTSLQFILTINEHKKGDEDDLYKLVHKYGYAI